MALVYSSELGSNTLGRYFFLIACFYFRGKDGRTDIELTIKTNNVVLKTAKIEQLPERQVKAEFEQFWEGHADNQLVGIRKLVHSFCPKVYGN